MLGKSAAVFALGAIISSSQSEESQCSVSIGSYTLSPDNDSRKTDTSDKSGPSSQKPNSCRLFNSPGWRISWRSRRQECNALRSCVFVGRSITGTCVPRDVSKLELELYGKNIDIDSDDSSSSLLRFTSKEGQEASIRRQETAKELLETVKKDKEFDDKEKKDYIEKVRTLLEVLDVNPAATDLAIQILKEEGGDAMQAYIRAQLLAIAAEEMQKQQQDLQKFAKGTIMELIESPDAPQMLARLFKEPSMCKTVRNGAQIALEHPYVEQKITELTDWLINEYLLGNGEAANWTVDETAKLIGWVLEQGWTEESLAPLLTWILSPEGGLDESVLISVHKAILLLPPILDDTMIWAVDETLKGDYYKDYAKGVLIEMLKSRGAQEAANAKVEIHVHDTLDKTFSSED